MMIAGWGQYCPVDSNISSPKYLHELIVAAKKGDMIARGNGRAYGDSAVNRQNTIDMKHFNRMLEFDDSVGQLVAESGVLLADIIHTFLPKGWFPAVTPGTKFVTLGGMVAADVHGKNHHKDGSFAKFIDWFEIIDESGNLHRCSPTENIELFGWTIGGMGLTGIILKIAFRLRRVETAWMKQRTLVAENIDHAMSLLEGSLDAAYSVAWIDCLRRGSNMGRAIVILGDHVQLENLPEKIEYKKKKEILFPFQFLSWGLNIWTVKMFNTLYYSYKKRNLLEQLVTWDKYFYPLDAIVGWNKIYGRNGFTQFQCVIPLLNSQKGLKELLIEISKSGATPFLAVLKRFGAQESEFSFPMEGYTLALDFPINKKTLLLMDRLDAITLKYGGRFYLAKDSRMSAETFFKSDKRVKNFKMWRESKSLSGSFCSVQSKRLKF
jgi:FAD/FMN-containing dehydrogenase